MRQPRTPDPFSGLQFVSTSDNSSYVSFKFSNPILLFPLQALQPQETPVTDLWAETRSPFFRLMPGMPEFEEKLEALLVTILASLQDVRELDKSLLPNAFSDIPLEEQTAVHGDIKPMNLLWNDVRECLAIGTLYSFVNAILAQTTTHSDYVSITSYR